MARKTYRDTVHVLEGKKGTTQQRIQKSRQPRRVKHRRAKSYSDSDLISRTAKRLKELFYGPKTYAKKFEGQAARTARRRRAREKY